MADPASIVKTAYAHGGSFFLSRTDGDFYLTAMQEMPDSFLLTVEQNKLAVFTAIGGLLVSSVTTTTQPASGSASEILPLLADLLEQRGTEVLPQDEITLESLNRHYYHFSLKFDAIAAAFRSLQ